MTKRRTRVAVIGCGAAGSVAALVLAQAGVPVIAVEAGPLWEVEDFVPDELDSYAFANRLGPKWNAEPVARRSGGRTTTGQGLNMANGVGGSALHYAGHAWRFHPEDFRVRSHNTDVYGADAIPASSSVEDWPVDYAELEPYYDAVEKQIGVSGTAGVLCTDGDLDRPEATGAGNPFEGPRRADYPMPALREHTVGKLVAEAAAELGYHPFMGPTAVNSVAYKGRPASNYCGFCLGYACRIAAKGSPNNAMLADALWTGNLDVLSSTEVIDFTTNDDGRIRSISCVDSDTGDVTMIEADVFVLSAYVFETVRQLLLHRSATFPNGLANTTGQVGRHFMTHRFDAVAMRYPDRHLNRFGGPQGQRMAIDDLNADNFDHSGLGFIQGGHIFAPNEWHPIQDTAVVPPTVPSWGREYRRYVQENWNRTGLLLSNVECLPYPDNRLQLDDDTRDERGRPLLVADYATGTNEERLVDFLLERMTELAYASGADLAWTLRSEVLPSQHDAGGTRMGDDPSTSVVDRWCRAHDSRNLFVVGPSVFPTASGLNPSVTVQALAWRAAEYIEQNCL